MKEFQVLKAAIDKAFTRGVYNTEEAANIIPCIMQVEHKLIEAEKPSPEERPETNKSLKQK